ncbi:MAG: threonylcarbamoyl-AMP synthase [Rickettsiales bacterium]|nr:threonylcarbamoyl-AMP synthase [Rickettsiales bacterium]
MVKIISEKKLDAVEIACNALKNGDVIAFATDTVYGIACDASNTNAVEKLYEIKKRQTEKPIAIFVRNIEVAEKIFLFDELAKKIANKFLPGALTLVLQKGPQSSENLAHNLNNQDDYLGFRIVDREFINKLMIIFNGILAVTSANLSNEKPAINSKDVEKYFLNSKLSLIIDGGVIGNNDISTVVKIINGEIKILRHGAISEEEFKLC